MSDLLYLDHNATTPPSQEVIERMAASLREDYGNPSSVHHFGQRAKAAIGGTVRFAGGFNIGGPFRNAVRSHRGDAGGG